MPPDARPTAGRFFPLTETASAPSAQPHFTNSTHSLLMRLSYYSFFSGLSFPVSSPGG
jgi:hypothetical protein